MISDSLRCHLSPLFSQTIVYKLDELAWHPLNLAQKFAVLIFFCIICKGHESHGNFLQTENGHRRGLQEAPKKGIFSCPNLLRMLYRIQGSAWHFHLKIPFAATDCRMGKIRRKYTAGITKLWTRKVVLNPTVGAGKLKKVTWAAFNKQNVGERSPEIHVFLG